MLLNTLYQAPRNLWHTVGTKQYFVKKWNKNFLHLIDFEATIFQVININTMD